MENKAHRIMNIKNQVLSLEQVQELINLRFDIKKHSSIKSNGKKVVTEDDFYIGGAPLFPTMTIGDIIEVLPEKIIEKYYGGNIISFMEINKKSVCYSCYHKCSESDIMAFISTQENLIDRLFDCLVWCIKQKHIEL